MLMKYFCYNFLFVTFSFCDLKIETIQIINNLKIQTPIKAFIFFFKDITGMEQIKEKDNNDLLEIIKDIKYFYYFNKGYLLTKPIKIELVEGEISKKIILHNSQENLKGIFIFFISFDGVFQKTFFIPGDNDGCKNMIIFLENNKIVVKNGLFTKKNKNNIINNIKKS
jgi:hypothetical protein